MAPSLTNPYAVEPDRHRRAAHVLGPSALGLVLGALLGVPQAHAAELDETIGGFDDGVATPSAQLPDGWADGRHDLFDEVEEDLFAVPADAGGIDPDPLPAPTVAVLHGSGTVAGPPTDDGERLFAALAPEPVPVEPAAEPVEPVVEQVEPVVGLVEPVVGLVEPVVGLVEPVVEPVVEPAVPPVATAVQPAGAVRIADRAPAPAPAVGGEDSGPLAQRSASSSPIRPGAIVRSENGQCTAGPLFTNGREVFVSAAAHCAATDDDINGSGCEEPTAPVGSSVTVERDDLSVATGRLAYNSWQTMRQNRVSDRAVCDSNDFALIRLPPADAAAAEPSIPQIGGPTGVAGRTPTGTEVFSFQPNRGNLPVKSGRVVGTGLGGRTVEVRMDAPAVSGDSGSVVVDSAGRVVGLMTTNRGDDDSVSRLQPMLDYANRHGGLGLIRLLPGNAPFRAPTGRSGSPR